MVPDGDAELATQVEAMVQREVQEMTRHSSPKSAIAQPCTCGFGQEWTGAGVSAGEQASAWTVTGKGPETGAGAQEQAGTEEEAGTGTGTGAEAGAGQEAPDTEAGAEGGKEAGTGGEEGEGVAREGSVPVSSTMPTGQQGVVAGAGAGATPATQGAQPDGSSIAQLLTEYVQARDPVDDVDDVEHVCPSPDRQDSGGLCGLRPPCAEDLDSEDEHAGGSVACDADGGLVQSWAGAKVLSDCVGASGVCAAGGTVSGKGTGAVTGTGQRVGTETGAGGIAGADGTLAFVPDPDTECTANRAEVLASAEPRVHVTEAEVHALKQTMYLAGRTVHLYFHRGLYEAVYVNREHPTLNRIELYPNMLSDHAAKAYLEALQIIKVFT